MMKMDHIKVSMQVHRIETDQFSNFFLGILEFATDLNSREGTKMANENIDLLLGQHISRQLGNDRTDYVCRLCAKVCKSRDECANHIEVSLL